MTAPNDSPEQSRWNPSASKKFSELLRAAAIEASRPLPYGSDLAEQWEAQSEGRASLKALLAALAFVGKIELEHCATALLAELTLLGGGAINAMGQPGRDAGLAWTISELAACGALIDAFDEEGWAPIHQQACMGHDLAVAALVEAGSHPGLETRRIGHRRLSDSPAPEATNRQAGTTPAQFALESGHDNLSQWLAAKSTSRELERASAKRALWLVDLSLQPSSHPPRRLGLAFEIELPGILPQISLLAGENTGHSWRSPAQSSANALPRAKACSSIFSRLTGKVKSAAIQDPSIFARAACGYEFVAVQRIALGGPIPYGFDAGEEACSALATACNAIGRAVLEQTDLFDPLSPFAPGSQRLPALGELGAPILPRQADALDALASAARSRLEKSALLRQLAPTSNQPPLRRSL